MAVLSTRRKKPALQARRRTSVGSGRKEGRGTQGIRIIKLIEILREPGSRHTLKELATRFNVVVRTIRRDLKTLKESGFKIVQFGAVYHCPENPIVRSEVALDLLRNLLSEMPNPKLALAFAWLQSKPVSQSLIESALTNVLPYGPSQDLYNKLKKLTRKDEPVNANAA